MKFEAAGVSLQGRRKKNEDALGLFPQWKVFAVADGLGGLQFGERASAGAIDGVAQEGPSLAKNAERLQQDSSMEARDVLFQTMEGLFERTSAELHAMVRRKRAPMGTTLTAVAFAGDRMTIGHVGDSRIYRIRNGRAEILTTDHSVAATRLRRGLITLEEYYKSNQRNVLTQSLGPSPNVDPDVVEAEVRAGDIVLLCTDGIWGRLQPDRLAQLAAEGTAQDAAQNLAANAISYGSTDNCTAVVIRIEDTGEKAGTPLPLALAKSRLFADFSEVDLGLLAPFVRYTDVPKGSVVIKEGAGGDEMYLVEYGEVEVSRQGKALTRLDAGAHFGEIPLPLARPRTTTITVTEDCRLLTFDRRHFDLLCARRPVLAVRVMRRLLVDLATQLVDARET